MTIRIESSDWLKNAAIIGLMRILDKSATHPHYLEFDEEDLVDFEQKYFQYFRNTYTNFTSWNKIVEQHSWLHSLAIEKMTEKDLEKLNEMIKLTKYQLSSNSYVNTYPIIPDLIINIQDLEAKLVKVVKRKGETLLDIQVDIQLVREQLFTIIDLLKQTQVKKYITSKNVIYDVIAHFWSGVSFLHKENNKNDMFKVYHDYFLVSLNQYIQEKKVEKKYEKYKYQCSTCNNKIATLSKPRSFNMNWISKMGADTKRKTSHYWNCESDIYICPVCNFLYSCVPAGFTYFNGKGLFVNENSSIKTMQSVNQVSLQKVTNFAELEEKSYYQILDTLDQAQSEKMSKEIQNIQIVKLDKENTVRPYTFNNLSKERLDIMMKNKKRIEKLVGKYVKTDEGFLNLYEEVTTRIYENRNQFDLLYKLLVLGRKSDFSNTHYMYLILLISNSSQKEGKRMDYRKINEFQKLGIQLQEAYKDSPNKLPGITHRLLNATKVKNEHRFTETLLNAYMSKGKKVPLEFIESLHDQSRFQTIAYAFLLGLQGGNEKKTDEKEEKKNE